MFAPTAACLPPGTMCIEGRRYVALYTSKLLRNLAKLGVYAYDVGACTCSSTHFTDSRGFPARDKNYVTQTFAHASAILVHMSIW